MKKKLLIFFLLPLLFPSLAFATIDPYCDNEINQSFIEKIYKQRIKHINVKVENYRSWTRNSLNILIGNFRWIPEKYKQRFNANIEVKFENDLTCSFKARIRHNGDQKDHIALKDNSIIQSIDVHLKTGNVNGITKFKLLRPNTRGNYKDEIILTELLREFNYLSPRTNYVDVEINEVKSKMLFQEKATKEMLEFNKRREGPILEGDERFFFKLAKDVPDNQLSNEAIGMMPLLEKGANAMLAKQTNSNWMIKGKIHSEISLNALSNLNLIYLLYSNKYKDEKNNFFYSSYTLDNNLLAFNDPKKVLILDIYNLLVFATNGWHGLVPNNRKFYWNSIENFFEPINYDSDAYIDPGISSFHLPFSNQIEKAFDDLEKLLSNIEIDNFAKKVNFRGLNLSKKETEEKITTIKENLEELRSMYIKIDPETIAHNRNNKIQKKMWDKYYASLYEIDPNIYLVRQTSKKNLFKRCINKSSECINYEFNDNQLRDLAEGELVKNGKSYQYVGQDLYNDNLIFNEKYKKIKFKKGYFYFDQNIKYSFNEEKKTFNIYQDKPGARAFFYKNILDNININFHGYNKKINFTPPNYPIDQNNLTGCLSLISLTTKNLNITSNNSSCEDSVNLINVEGFIDSINIKNSFRDGLDIDFSKLRIANINISSSLNDCLDLSYGEYELSNLNLSNCEDKGLSVGERSNLFLKKIIVNNADTGIAIKDSSIATIEYLNIKETSKCIDVYRKKQEFSGAIVNLKSVKCHDGKIIKQKGSFINGYTL